MNTLSNFNEFALSRGEMKKVNGGLWSGSCRCANGSGWSGAAMDAASFIFFDAHYCGNKGSISCVGRGSFS